MHAKNPRDLRSNNVGRGRRLHRRSIVTHTHNITGSTNGRVTHEICVDAMDGPTPMGMGREREKFFTSFHSGWEGREERLPDGYSRIFRSYVFGPLGFWTLASLRFAVKFDPFLSLDCAGVEGVGAQGVQFCHLATLRGRPFVRLLACLNLNLISVFCTARISSHPYSSVTSGNGEGDDRGCRVVQLNFPVDMKRSDYLLLSLLLSLSGD